MAIEYSNSNLVKLLLDIKELMACFLHCKIVYSSRACNDVAHSLARHAWFVDEIVLWSREMPHLLEHLIWLDRLFV